MGISSPLDGIFFCSSGAPLGEQVLIRQRHRGARRDPRFDEFPTIHDEPPEMSLGSKPAFHLFRRLLKMISEAR